MSFYTSSVPKENKIAYIGFPTCGTNKSGVLRNFLSNKKTASREKNYNWNNYKME
jgi:hypothetical protein